MRNSLLFGALALSINAFGQSKKEQIAALNYSIDSLNTVLSKTIDNASKEADNLNKTINNLKTQNSQLKSDVSSLQSSRRTYEYEIDKLMTSFEQLAKKNLELKVIESNWKAFEGFHSFLKRFLSDHTFQKLHCQFPLKRGSLGWVSETDTEIVWSLLDKKDFKFDDLSWSCDKVVAYDLENFSIEVKFQGCGNGLLIYYNFQLIDGEWFLVSTEDHSM